MLHWWIQVAAVITFLTLLRGGVVAQQSSDQWEEIDEGSAATETCKSVTGDSARTSWCQLSCNSPTPNCPQSLCTCSSTALGKLTPQPVKTCRSKHADQRSASRTIWCQKNCNAPKPNCPTKKCTCTSTPMKPTTKRKPKPTSEPNSKSGKTGQRIVTETGTDPTFKELMAQKKLWRVTDAYRKKKGSNYVYQVDFPTVPGSKVQVTPEPAYLLSKGPFWRNDAFRDYKIHILVHSSIPAPLNQKYPRWHQRVVGTDGNNHHIFRLFTGEVNLWGGRGQAARIEAGCTAHTYVSRPLEDIRADPQWHSFEGTLTLVKPVNHATIMQGYNAMLSGWWTDGLSIVDADGNSNIILKSRYGAKNNHLTCKWIPNRDRTPALDQWCDYHCNGNTLDCPPASCSCEEDDTLRTTRATAVAGASLTGVPVHILHRDNGFDYEVYVNGRQMIDASMNRDPRENVLDKYGKEKDYNTLGDNNTFNIFRYGMYMGHHDVKNDALTIWSGVKVNSENRLAPPTCELTSAGFQLPHKIPAFGTKFTVLFDLTLTEYNKEGVKSNIFWLGERSSKVVAVWLTGNKPGNHFLLVQWAGGGMLPVRSVKIKKAKKVSVKIIFDPAKPVTVFIDGAKRATGTKPVGVGKAPPKKTCKSVTGTKEMEEWCQRSCFVPNPTCPASRCTCQSAAAQHVRNGYPLWLSVSGEETADVCLTHTPGAGKDNCDEDETCVDETRIRFVRF